VTVLNACSVAAHSARSGRSPTPGFAIETEYVQKRFAGSDTFSVLTQVDVLRGWVATPD